MNSDVIAYPGLSADKNILPQRAIIADPRTTADMGPVPYPGTIADHTIFIDNRCLMTEKAHGFFSSEENSMKSGENGQNSQQTKGELQYHRTSP